MKNIYLIATDKPSILVLSKRNHLQFLKDNASKNINNHFTGTYQNIYITSSKEIKEGDWFYSTFNDNQPKIQKRKGHWRTCFNQHIIILTTDQELISDGVQAIDDTFLEWFIKNPTCEEVKIDLVPINEFGSEITVGSYGFDTFKYKIIIPQKEPKQDYSEVHLKHCYQGEYEDGCKYGEDDCPAKPKEDGFKRYSHLYGKLVTMDDRSETQCIWSEELALKNKGKWIPQETICTSSIVKYCSKMLGVNINIIHKPHGVFNYYPIIVNIRTGLVEDLHDNILLWGVDEKTCVNKTAEYIFKNFKYKIWLK